MKLWINTKDQTECLAGYPPKCELCTDKEFCIWDNRESKTCPFREDIKKFKDKYIYYQGNIGGLLTNLTAFNIFEFKKTFWQLAEKQETKNKISPPTDSNFWDWMENFKYFKQYFKEYWELFVVLCNLRLEHDALFHCGPFKENNVKVSQFSEHLFNKILCCFEYLKMYSKDPLKYGIKKFYFATKQDSFFMMKAYEQVNEFELNSEIQYESCQITFDPGKFIETIDNAYSNAFSAIHDFYSDFKEYDLIFKVDNLDNLIMLETEQIISLNLPVNICKNCNLPFVPYHKSNTLYCDRISPQDHTKSCKQFGAQQAWKQRLKDDESKKLYRNIYMSKQMLAKRNPDIAEYSESFQKYKDLSKQWKQEVKNGVKTEEQYIEWLKTVKEKKVL